MEVVKASPFSYRDTIQHVLPNLLGYLLFAPLLPEPKHPEIALICVAVLSFVADAPLRRTTRLFYRNAPWTRRRFRAAEAELARLGSRWNLDKLFRQSASEEEREYLYLTGSYANFYRLSGFYLFLIGCLSVWRLVLAAWNVGARGVLLEELEVAGGWSPPALVVALIAFVLAESAARDFFFESEQLFGRRGQYSALAHKLHGRDSSLAKGVWGWVESGGRPVSEADVSLRKPSGEVLASAKTDVQGGFLFEGEYAGISLCIEVSHAGVKQGMVVPTGVPEVVLTLPAKT